MNAEDERKTFDDWHFLDWKLNNAEADTVEFAKALYDRVYMHNHTSCVREIEFKAWLASTNREGYKLVPVQPSNDTIVAIERKVEEQLEASAIDADPFRLDGENIYTAMINSCDNN